MIYTERYPKVEQHLEYYYSDDMSCPITTLKFATARPPAVALKSVFAHQSQAYCKIMPDLTFLRRSILTDEYERTMDTPPDYECIP
jgi:hypothetical protein